MLPQLGRDGVGLCGHQVMPLPAHFKYACYVLLAHVADCLPSDYGRSQLKICVGALSIQGGGDRLLLRGRPHGARPVFKFDEAEDVRHVS